MSTINTRYLSTEYSREAETEKVAWIRNQNTFVRERYIHPR